MHVKPWARGPTNHAVFFIAASQSPALRYAGLQAAAMAAVGGGEVQG